MYPDRALQTSKLQQKSGKSVTYVMSRDQRTRHNHGLAFAQKLAIERKQPLAVVFVLHKKGNRAREHYRFMIDGLMQIEADLRTKNIPLITLFGSPLNALQNYCSHTSPSAIVVDFSPLNGPRRLADKLANTIDTEMFVVDSHNSVPFWKVTDKQEIGARTLRPKIHRLLPSYLDELPQETEVHPHVWPGVVMPLYSLNSQIDDLLAGIPSNGQILTFESGEAAAAKALEEFVNARLDGYAELRNKPELAHTSHLSPYLHYGQISSTQVVLRTFEELRNTPNLQTDIDVLIEEMVVRKELSDNFCYYTSSYRTIEGAPLWAQKTIERHRADTREHIYSLDEFEHAKTHDPAWNAAQMQLVTSGKMHGYMRMYWAKKVLEWSATVEEALQTLIFLNDFYSIDGGDPSGYTGIMWSVCGVHDRPWGERPVYGIIRSMVYGGLKRKFDIHAYEEQWGT